MELDHAEERGGTCWPHRRAALVSVLHCLASLSEKSVDVVGVTRGLLASDLQIETGKQQLALAAY